MVKAWKEKVVIPTYEVGKPEKNPIFLEKRVYQGSSGVVYPYPVIESMSDEKVDKEYNAIFIENEYIKVMILPELGGRVQMAYDKIRERHFIYYNHVELYSDSLLCYIVSLSNFIFNIIISSLLAKSSSDSILSTIPSSILFLNSSIS